MVKYFTPGVAQFCSSDWKITRHALLAVAFVLVFFFFGLMSTNAQTAEARTANATAGQEHQIKIFKPHPETGLYTWTGCPGCKERCDLRTATTRTYQKPDGTHVVQKYSEPVHYLKDGVWLSIAH